jgi:galactarate dehydratase
MAHAIFSKEIPADLPNVAVEREDMARVTPEDWRDLRGMARGYCRNVDGTRSRKRVDQSATITRNGYGLYGTDDVSDDVTQDAVLLFARKFGKVIRECPVTSLSVTTREPDSWQHVCRDGRLLIVTRGTVKRWAVHDAARRYGLRPDIDPDDIDATPGAQIMRELPRAEYLAAHAFLASNSEIVFRLAWGDGQDFPVLGRVLPRAEAADDLGRAGILNQTAHELYGGAYGSRWKVRKARDAALAEWRVLSARLDEARNTVAYDAARTPTTD